MKPIEYLNILRKNGVYYNTPEFSNEGFTPIGWGHHFNERYNIPRMEIYCMDGGKLVNDKAGNLRHIMYYVTNQFYTTYIMDTPLKSSMSEQVRIAEQYLGKTVMGTIHGKAFLPDSIRICNQHTDNHFLAQY